MKFSSQNLTVGLIVSFGLSVWVYVKMIRSTSSDVKTSSLIGGICFAVLFLLIMGVLSMLPSWWNG